MEITRAVAVGGQDGQAGCDCGNGGNGSVGQGESVEEGGIVAGVGRWSEHSGDEILCHVHGVGGGVRVSHCGDCG